MSAEPADWIPLAGGEADLGQQVAVIRGERVRLTTKERDLLAYLVRHADRTVTRQELVVNVWGHPPRASQEPVYSAVKRLRAKIDAGTHQHVLSVHGDGYRWSPPPAAPRAEPTPTSAVTRFFGRAAELAETTEAFAGGARLVTLVGPGGAGKTRCALEIGARRAHVFCDLSNATSEASAISGIAAALEIPLEEVGSAATTIGRALAAAPGRLVVLDNVENVVEIVSRLVARWLPFAPVLLATSREPLRVRGERVVHVGPLALADAALLLEDRVAMAGGAKIDADVSRTILERVDRLPLAIELAAAQLPELGPRGLLEGLDAQLETLVAGARDAPARHASVRAAVESSLSLLDGRDRDALFDLAVFRGSFTLAAARAVLATPDATAVLADLSRRSLVRRDADRFVLYAAVRELASERGGARREAEARHAGIVATLGEAAVKLLDGPRHQEGAMDLAADLAEIELAWERSIDGDATRAARLALVLDHALGAAVSRRTEILDRSRSALAPDDPLQGALLLAAARVPGAPPHLADDALSRLADDPALAAEARLTRGERLAVKDLAAARAELGAALELATLSGVATTRGRILAATGEVAWAEGRVFDASATLREALGLHERVGDQRSIARTAALLAHVERVETGGRTATALLARARAASEELGDPLVSARVFMDIGQHLTRTGDQAGAGAALKEAALLLESVGFARERAFLDLHVAETLVGLGDFGGALDRAMAALAALPDGEDVGRSTLHEAIACMHLLENELAAAADFLESGLAIAKAQRAERSACTLLGKRGLLHLASGDPERALRDFDEATKKNEARGAVTMAGASLADRAMAAWALGRDEEAERDFERARRILRGPPAESLDGRMLAVCRAAGRGFGAVRAGADGAAAREVARAEVADVFARVRAQDWDVVLRLADWLLGRIGEDA